MEKEEMKRTQLFIPNDDLKKLKKIAIDEETTVSDIVRKLIKEFLNKKK